MNEHEVLRKVEGIHSITGMIVEIMSKSDDEGRMESLEEARRLDVLSAELNVRMAELPANPLQMVVSEDSNLLARGLLKEVQFALRVLSRIGTQESESGIGEMQKASSGRLQAYAAY